MELIYYQGSHEFNITAQNDHLEKKNLLLFLHIQGSFVDYPVINHTCHSYVIKQSTLAHTHRYFSSLKYLNLPLCYSAWKK